MIGGGNLGKQKITDDNKGEGNVEKEKMDENKRG